MSKAFLSRRATFSASHRLHSDKLSEQENQALFGKCNSKNGHGHNYILEVVVYGEIDEHGIVMNLSDLKNIINEDVISRVDHKHLNLDVPEFKNLNPTAENIALVCWNWLVKKIPANLLYEVRIHETENNIASYRGDA